MLHDLTIPTRDSRRSHASTNGHYFHAASHHLCFPFGNQKFRLLWFLQYLYSFQKWLPPMCYCNATAVKVGSLLRPLYVVASATNCMLSSLRFCHPALNHQFPVSIQRSRVFPTVLGISLESIGGGEGLLLYARPHAVILDLG
jgi:hypothetical protein